MLEREEVRNGRNRQEEKVVPLICRYHCSRRRGDNDLRADAEAHRVYCMGNMRDQPIDTILKGEYLQHVRVKMRAHFEKCAEECSWHTIAVDVSWRKDAVKRKKYSLFFFKRVD